MNNDEVIGNNVAQLYDNTMEIDNTDRLIGDGGNVAGLYDNTIEIDGNDELSDNASVESESEFKLTKKPDYHVPTDEEIQQEVQALFEKVTYTVLVKIFSFF